MSPAVLGDNHLVGESVKLHPQRPVLQRHRQPAFGWIGLEFSGGQTNIDCRQELAALRRRQTSGSGHRFRRRVVTHRNGSAGACIQGGPKK